jgi:hypothetical protein
MRPEDQNLEPQALPPEPEDEQDECEHTDIDKHRMCLDCGKDMLERIIVRAEYRSEGDL